MLGSAIPAAATIQTSTSSATSSPPSRPSRLRRLSYLRSYSHNHSQNTTPSTSRVESPPVPVRNNSSPTGVHVDGQQQQIQYRQQRTTANIQSAEDGWLPSVMRDAPLQTTTSTSTASASSHQASNSIMSATPSLLPAEDSRRSESSIHAETVASISSGDGPVKELPPTIKFIPHIEARSGARPSLHFTALTRTLKDAGNIVRVGRYSERDAASSDPNVLPVGFKSKVVSRRHCEFWCTNGQWFVKDVKSSSGTFLNHVRLSSPGTESRPFPVNDGDVIQLGIDFKGGEEVIFRCVKIRLECNRGWQKSLNNFNTSAHRRILKNALKTKARDSDAASVNSSECSICLNPVAPCQALFVAPCSHVWHYKCIRNLIHGPSYPNFLCPNCRFVADLDAEVEPIEEDEFEELEDDEHQRGESSNTREKPPATVPPESSENDPASISRTARSREARRPAGPTTVSGDVTDEELSGIMTGHSLARSRGSESDSPTNEPTNGQSSNATTQPINVSSNTTNPALQVPRSTTPTSHNAFAIGANSAVMTPSNDHGPTTPRNDAGPWVFDGSGSRNRVDGIAAVIAADLPPAQR